MCIYTCMDEDGETVNVDALTEELAKIEGQKKLAGKLVCVIRNKPARQKRHVMEA